MRGRERERESERNGKEIREDTIGPTGSRFRGQMTLKLFTTHTHQFVLKKYKHKHIFLFFTIKSITVSHFSHRILISLSIFISLSLSLFQSSYLSHLSFTLHISLSHLFLIFFFFRRRENVFHRMSDPLE